MFNAFESGLRSHHCLHVSPLHRYFENTDDYSNGNVTAISILGVAPIRDKMIRGKHNQPIHIVDVLVPVQDPTCGCDYFPIIETTTPLPSTTDTQEITEVFL